MSKKVRLDQEDIGTYRLFIFVDVFDFLFKKKWKRKKKERLSN